MKIKRKKEDGAFAIEAVMGLTFFMLSVLAIMLMSLIIRVESQLQYAVDQTAKEMSSYYYILDAVGVAKYTSGSAGASAEETKNINDLIDNVLSFSSEADDMAGTMSNMDTIDISQIGQMSGNVEQMATTANDMWGNITAIRDDPKGQIMATLSVFAHSLGNKTMSYFVTPFLCRMLMPKYLAGDYESTNEYLENLGIEGGIDSIDFSHSSLLGDGRTIKIVAVFKLNTKKITFGVLDTDIIFRKTAYTAAWVTPNDSGEIKSIYDAYSSGNTQNAEE